MRTRQEREAHRGVTADLTEEPAGQLHRQMVMSAVRTLPTKTTLKVVLVLILIKTNPSLEEIHLEQTLPLPKPLQAREKTMGLGTPPRSICKALCCVLSIAGRGTNCVCITSKTSLKDKIDEPGEKKHDSF